MKNVCLNKKGFTLVELLAVIVILALLIVITANTVLPMLGRTKETGMTTYAKRVLNNALTNFEADKIAGTTIADGDSKYYKIYADLTKNESYFGCVQITNDAATGENYTYAIKMFTTKDNLFMSASGITDVTELGTVSFEDLTASATASSVEAVCGTKFTSISATAPTGS